MSAQVVYFSDDVARLRETAASCFKIISEDFGKNRVALKVHFGEGVNDTHVKAEWLKDVTKFFTEPVFVECNVLYKGGRTVRESHVETARRHGFDFIPIDILDGEIGQDYIEVAVSGGSTKTAKLGAGIAKYDNLIAVSHFKGHMATEFGGALKNIGMGLGARPGKLEMHSIASPYVKSGKCAVCLTCVGACPADAISVKDNTAAIDPEKCIGCVRCIAVCPQGAVDVPWNMSESVNNMLMEKIAEYASAALKDRGWWFMNFITGLTFDCDCLPMKQTPFMQDVGVLLSRDPVAIDQASLDLVKGKNNGADPFRRKHNVDGMHILEYAEKLGLGSRIYELEKLPPL